MYLKLPEELVNICHSPGIGLMNFHALPTTHAANTADWAFHIKISDLDEYFSNLICTWIFLTEDTDSLGIWEHLYFE